MAGAVLALTGCSATAIGNELVIDLKTDLLPGVEFVSVRTAITAALSAGQDPSIKVERKVNAEQDFFQGVRLGEFQQLATSEVTVEVALLDAEGEILISRPTRVTLNGVRAVTVVISRDCRGVECPLADGDPNFSACLGGSCVDPRCHPEALEYCEDYALECSADAECGAEHICTTARCVERVCFVEADDGLCEALQMCIPESGCVDLPPTCIDGVMNGNETNIDCGGDCDECTTGWPKSFGDTTSDNGVALGVDSAGNLYVTGTFEGSIDLGGGALQGTPWFDGADVFLASFDANGIHRWSTLIALTGANKQARSLVVDSNDNVVLAATGSSFGELSRIYSYDSDGNLRWSASMGGSDEFGVGFKDVATDADGDVYIVGEYGGSYGQFASNNLSVDVMHAKYDGNTGSMLWANEFGSSSSDGGSGIVSAPDGMHFITGTYNGVMFVNATDADGVPQWSLNVGSTGLVQGRALALGGNNQLFVGGEFEQQVDFGTGAHTSNGATDGFLISVDATTGQVQWSKQFGGTDADVVRDVYVSESGKVVLCGDYYLNFNADGTPFTGQGSWDAYVLGYDALSGAFDAWQSYGGTGEDRAYGLAFDQGGSMYLTGGYSGSINLAGTALSSVGQTDIYLLRTTAP